MSNNQFPSKITSGVSSLGSIFFLSPSGAYNEELTEDGYVEAARRWNLVSELIQEMSEELGIVEYTKEPTARGWPELVEHWRLRLIG